MSEIEEKIRTPRQNRSIKTKEAITEAAMKLFSEKGYHQTNTKEIAAAAGVSTGSFYSYFIDKRAVFIDVLNIYNEALLSQIKTSLAETDLDQLDKSALIVHLVDTLIESHQVYTGFHKELAVMVLMDEGIRQLMEEQYELGRQLTLQYLQQGQKEIKTSDLEATSVVIFESTGVIVDKIAFSPGKISPDRLKSQLVQMITDYLYK
ncbi:TetR/AcrR family transcriptional regulator [Paenibacillus donghaensis]|uniref:TetR family transcriptional regulator n=1 Tax=Paenibacillus donghaensis TaxID=414771 RepID=A0A2Z2KJ42_9BACL|nr:TetR/AcrR family transcriptional regulator [Paenibacillus donghaensis]ASA25977.1 TetR family transcriptional regulator [Paenibacillus donghaensis]